MAGPKRHHVREEGVTFEAAGLGVFEGRPALVFGLKNCIIGPKPCSVAATWDFVGRRLNGEISARFVPTDRYIETCINS